MNVDKIKSTSVEVRVFGVPREVGYVEGQGVSIKGVSWDEVCELLTRCATPLDAPSRTPLPPSGSSLTEAAPMASPAPARTAPAPARDAAPAPEASAPTPRSERLPPSARRVRAAPEAPAQAAPPAPAPKAVQPAPAKKAESPPPAAEEPEPEEEEAEEEPLVAAADPGEIDPRLLNASRVRDVIQILIEQGKHTKADLVEECVRLQPHIRALEVLRMNLKARVEQAADIYGIP